MPDQTKEPPQSNDLLKNSSLYREFQAEREEILKHKWIESEKAGRDIGFERALTDWIIKHRSKWRKSRQLAGHCVCGRSFNAAPRGCQGQMMQSKVQSPKSQVLNSVREERTRHFIPGLPSP